jgi:hypothetical protein
MMTGFVLSAIGALIIAQVTGGQALQRLGVLAP